MAFLAVATLASASFGQSYSYYTSAPCRAFDSRSGSPVGSASPTVVQLSGVCGIPSSAGAVAINVTVVSPSSAGQLRIRAAGTSAGPEADLLTMKSGRTRANNRVIQPSASGAIEVQTSAGTTHVLVDVYGYFAGGPVLTPSGAAPTFTEAGGPVAVDGGLTVTDSLSATVGAATVTITNLLDSGAETLAANTAGTSITAVYAAPTLTLTGTDTVVHYQQVLQSVTYDNSSQNPTTTTRSLAYQADDGAGTSAAVTKSVSIVPVNDAPVLTAGGGSPSFTEGGGAVVVDSGITVSDPDNANLASATVTITNLLDSGAETLAANTTGTSITASYVAPTLTLSGSDTLAHYEQVLRTVAYDNSSQNPTTTTRSIAFVANDGTANSNTATTSVSVIAVNNAPVVTTTGGTTAFTEAGGAVVVDAGVTATDADNANLSSATVTITNLQDSGAETLAANTTGASITASYVAPTLTLSGSDTVAHYQQVLRTVTYDDSSQNPSTTARTISFVVNDGTTNSATATKTVTVGAVNDAPVVTTTGGTTSFTEDGGAVTADAGVTVTDPDNANLASATVTITNLLDSGAETLAATTTGTSITASYAAPTLTLSGSDTLAHYQQVLRTVTYDNSSQNPTTTTRVVSFVANDGATNSVAATKGVTIAAVNDAPVVTTTGGATSFTEDGPDVTVDSGVTVTDPDNTNLVSATVTITNLLDAGSEFLGTNVGGTSITASYVAPTLTLSGSDTLAHYQQVLQQVKYQNTSQNPNTTSRVVAFVANDGTTNSNTGTKTVTVAAVNDPPLLTAGGGSPSFSAGGPAVVVDNAITALDVDSANLTGATVTISDLGDSGQETLAANTTGTSISASYAAPTLTLSGVDTVAHYQQVLRTVTYVDAQTTPTGSSRSISFQATDGIANSNTVSTTVTFNFPPVLTTGGGTTTFTEDGGAVQVEPLMTVVDGDSSTLASATATITNLLDVGQEALAANTTGTSITASYVAPTLTLTGSDTVAHYQQVLRTVTYNDASQNPNATARTIDFVANDGTLNCATLHRAVTVVPVNDAPVLAGIGSAASFTEDGGAVTVTNAITVSDVDNANLASATVTIANLQDSGAETLAANTSGTSITAIYTAPTLTLSGSDTLAHYQQVLRTVTYANSSQNPSTTARSIAFVGNDGTTNSNSATATVNITAVNDAPVLSSIGAGVTFTEDGGAVQLSSTITPSDVDNANLASATVTITNLLDSGAETLAATTAGTSITASYVAPTLTLSGSDTIAHYQQVLRSVTYNDSSQNPSTTARSVSFTVNDGALASNTLTQTVTVVAVNDAPVLGNPGSVTFTEDGGPVVIASGVTASDVDNTNLASGTVTISNLTDSGAEFLAANTAGTSIIASYTAPTLTLSGSDTVAHYQQVLRTVTYNNTSQNPTASPTRSVSFKVNDGALDSNTLLSSVTVVPVNDPPVITTNPITYTTPGNTQLHVAGASLAGVAKWSDTSSVVTKAGPFTDVDGPVAPALVAASGSSANGGSFSLAVDGSFTYVPPVGFTGTDSFTYQVTDSQAATTGTVNITVGARVWYIRDVVDANNAAGGDGRSTNAFDSITAFNAATTNNGDIIYIFEGNTATTPLVGQITLKDGQKLWGQGIDLNVPSFGTALVTATNKPHIKTTAASTDVVLVPATAGNRQNVEIRGLDLEATGGSGGTASNAITVNATGANIVGVTISDDNVRGATGKGVNLVASTTGAYTATVQNDTVTATGIGVGLTTNAAGTATLTASSNSITSSAANAFDARTAAGAGALRLAIDTQSVTAGVSGIVVDGSAAGTTTITSFANNAVDGNTVGNGIAVTSAIFDATPGGAFQTVSGGSTVVGASGNGVGASGIVLTNVAGDLSFADLDVFTAGGSGLKANGTTPYTGSAGFQIAVGAGVATIDATGGSAVDLATVKMNSLPFQQIKSTSSATTGVALNSVLGTFSAGSGSAITSSTGTGFQVGSSNASITYDGTINTTTGKGVDLTSNTGSTIAFTGTLTISSGANTAFNATGGGTVTATDTNSTLTSTTGTALNVANTTIGANGLKFKSISAGTAASGPANGIVLNNTGGSGGLTVTGSGSAASGGTIRKGGTGISLTSTKAPSFAWMQLNDFSDFAIRGNTVDGFTLTSSTINGVNGDNDVANEGSISFDELTGSAALTNVSVSGGWEDNLRLSNTTGSLNRLTITNCTIGANSASFGNAGLNLMASGTAVLNVTVTGSTFTGSRSHFVQFLLNGASTPSGDFVFTSNTFTQSMTAIAGAGDIFVSSGGNGNPTFTYNIQGNTMRDAVGNAINVSKGAGTGTFSGTIDGNVIGVSGVANSGSSQGNGIAIIHLGGGTHSTHITNNTVRRFNNDGILVQVGDNTSGGNGTVNATISGNTIKEPDSFALHGLELNIGTTSGDAHFLCAAIGGGGALKNDVVGAGNTANGGFEMRPRQRQSTTIRLPGYAGAFNDTAAVASFLAGQNTTSGAAAISASAASNGFVNGASCP